jgi:predicted RNase H-related nuclease YkuK (DUF458 family)
VTVRKLGKKRRLRVNRKPLLVRTRWEVAEEVRNSCNVADILGAASSTALAQGLQAKETLWCAVTGATGLSGKPGFCGFVVGADVGGDSRRGTTQFVVQDAFGEVYGCGFNVAVGHRPLLFSHFVCNVLGPWHAPHKGLEPAGAR